MSLKARITEDMKNAMRAKEATRLGAIRLLLSAMKQKEVDERVELSDADIVAIIDKMIKQRRDSIAQFEKGGRQDLAEQEKFEVGILQAYMPQALSDAEIDAEIAAAMAAEELILRMQGNRLDFSAPRVHYLTGRPLARLKNAEPVAFDIQVKLAAQQSSNVLRTNTARFVISYDLWEERYAVTKTTMGKGLAASQRSANSCAASRPLMPGMRTSSSRQLGAEGQSRPLRGSASSIDSKASALPNPSDSSRRERSNHASASRTTSSSSTR